jgi:hypothetical protein
VRALVQIQPGPSWKGKMKTSNSSLGCFTFLVYIILLAFLMIKIHNISNNLSLVNLKLNIIEEYFKEQIYMQREYNQLLYRNLKDKELASKR